MALTADVPDAISIFALALQATSACSACAARSHRTGTLRLWRSINYSAASARLSFGHARRSHLQPPSLHWIASPLSRWRRLTSA